MMEAVLLFAIAILSGAVSYSAVLISDLRLRVSRLERHVPTTGL
jgi:hypothetical protein